MKRPAPTTVPRVIQRRFPQVTKCYDALKPIEIEVTDEDGDGGASSDFQQCALARAACRQEHADHAVVSKRVVYIVKRDTAIRYAANERIRHEIVSFDRHHDFAPGSYTLRPTRPSDRLGAPGRHLTREDPRARHDAAARRWVRAPRVRDLNYDVVEAVPAKKKKARR